MESTAKLRYGQAIEAGNQARADRISKKYPSVLEKPEKEIKSKKEK